MRLLLLTCFLCLSLLGMANDGAFFASGNHLIPIVETEIAVQKEILLIQRINSREIKVIVDYEFYNPGRGKRLLVGFEAPSPSGDVDGTPKNGQHPYIRNFSVFMNGTSLSYKTAIVNEEQYFKKGKFKSQSVEEATAGDFEVNAPDFYYVYHFDAHFKKGINKIKHEYIFELSGSVDLRYDFNYILTAANRWANQQIDDFTLILDLGDYQDYLIDRSFFKGMEAWSQAKLLLDGPQLPYFEEKATPLRVLTGKEPVIFKKKNFHPKGELSVFALRNFDIMDIEEFNSQNFQLPYNFEDYKTIQKAVDFKSYKILRNLPFAIRGYVFKTAYIQKYYQSLSWYKANKNYRATIDDLSKEEQRWLEELEAQQSKKQ